MDSSRSQGPSVVGSLKRLVAIVTLGLILMFGVLLMLGWEFTESDTLWIALPLVVGLADLVLVPAVGSTVRPLPYSAGESDIKRISGGALRTVVILRMALAEAAALFGFASAFVAQSLVPFAIGFAFAVPLLLAFAWPSERVVDSVRRRLESGGVPADLEPSPRL